MTRVNGAAAPDVRTGIVPRLRPLQAGAEKQGERVDPLGERDIAL